MNDLGTVKLTKQQIDDMRTSLGLGAQPFTKESIDALCYLALKGLSARAEGGELNDALEFLREIRARGLCFEDAELSQRLAGFLARNENTS